MTTNISAINKYDPAKILVGLNKNQRTIVVIDNNYFLNLSRYCDCSVDLASMRKMFEDNCSLQKIYIGGYMVDLPPSHSFKLWCKTNGYIPKFKMFPAPKDNNRKPPNLRSDFFVGIMVEVIKAAYAKEVDHFVLFSGSSYWIPVVKLLNELNISTSMVSTVTHPSEIKFSYNEYLRTECTNFWEMDDILNLLDTKYHSEGEVVVRSNSREQSSAA